MTKAEHIKLLEKERHDLYRTIAKDMCDLQKDIDKFIMLGVELEGLNNVEDR